MDVVFQDAARDRREQERQRLFQQKFVAETPSWYHGAIHLGFTLIVTGTAMWYCWNHIAGAKWEWRHLGRFCLPRRRSPAVSAVRPPSEYTSGGPVAADRLPDEYDRAAPQAEAQGQPRIPAMLSRPRRVPPYA